MIDRVLVKLAQVFCIRIGIRERLEVDDELMRIESLSNVFDAFADLIANRICFDRGRRTERIVIAVSAASDGNRAVSIRTRETGVDDNLVDSLSEFFLKPAIIRKKSLGLA